MTIFSVPSNITDLCSGESGNISSPSDTELLGLGVASAVMPLRAASA